MHNRKWHHGVLGGVAVLTLGITLSACGSNAATTTTTTVPATIVSTPTTIATSTSTTTPAPQCSAGVLAISQSSAGAEAGTSSYAFTATNNGPNPCSLDGYPVLTLFEASAAGGSGTGDKLPITTQNTGSTPKRVTLAAKGTAEFRLSVTDVPVNGAGCSTVGSIDVTVPGTTEAIPVAESLQACGATVQVTAFGPPGSAQA